ncbi:MAG: hypothetical protein L0Y56_22675 [Nitrospira sp.]|nr:hypothetical protein [Nitrospira sp.]
MPDVRFDLPWEDNSERLGSRETPTAGAKVVVEVIPNAEIKRRERENTLAALYRSGWKIYGRGGAAQMPINSQYPGL